MPYNDRPLISGLWLAWFAYWWFASRRTKPTERGESIGSLLLHMLPLMFAFWLLWSERGSGTVLGNRLYPWAPWEVWLGAGVTALGLFFSVWARVHLGRNWSGNVTIKQGHELIESGPYAIVRHPIYSGMLVAFIGSGIARGEWRAALAVAVAWAALWLKLGVEERWMAERFGEKYTAYCRRVPALMPYLKRVGIGPPNAG